MVENTPQMPLPNISYEVRVAKEQKFRADLVRDKTEMEYRFRSYWSETFVLCMPFREN